MCAGDHLGTVDGHTANNTKTYEKLKKDVSKKHRKLYPECKSNVLTVAAKRDALLGNDTLVFREVPLGEAHVR